MIDALREQLAQELKALIRQISLEQASAPVMAAMAVLTVKLNAKLQQIFAIDCREEQALQNLIAIVRESLQEEATIRQQFHLGKQCQYVSYKLNSYLSRLIGMIKAPVVEAPPALPIWQKPLLEEERIIYIVLYHQQGDNIVTWERLLKRDMIQDTTVGRPVYLTEEEARRFIAHEPANQLFAYLSVILKKECVPTSPVASDHLQQPIYRVLPRDVLFEKVVGFVSGRAEYYLEQNGRLVPK